MELNNRNHTTNERRQFSWHRTII